MMLPRNLANRNNIGLENSSALSKKGLGSRTFNGSWTSLKNKTKTITENKKKSSNQIETIEMKRIKRSLRRKRMKGSRS